jgi:hypothetical protein
MRIFIITMMIAMSFTSCGKVPVPPAGGSMLPDSAAMQRVYEEVNLINMEL